VICIEAARDGFSLSVGGRPVLAHAFRRPCIDIGRAELAIKRTKAASKLRRKRTSWKPLRAFKILESGPEAVLVVFEGLLRVAIRLEGDRLRMSFSGWDEGMNLFRIRLAAFADERIYGCGEQYSTLDLKGLRVPLWVEEKGPCHSLKPLELLARRAGLAFGTSHSTYFPMPLFMSSKNYWCVVQTEAHSIFDFRKKNLTTIECWEPASEILIGSGTDAPAALASMSETLGRQPPLPPWSFDGAWLGVQGGATELERKLSLALEAGAKVAAVWLRDWRGPRAPGLYKDIVWDGGTDESRYPDLVGLSARLKSRGIRMLGYVNPFLAIDGRLYAEARDSGYCVKDAHGADYLVPATSRPAAMVDLTNPSAFAWIKSALRRELLASGFSGWLADSAEYLPADCVLASGEDPLIAHNRWPTLWARANREAIDEAGRGADALFLARSGWLGTARYAPAFWAGDQSADFGMADGLPSAVPAALSLSMSGVGFAHSDAGGFASVSGAKRDEGCLLRWMELAAFSPIFRTSEGDRSETNAQFYTNRATLAHLARMSDVYAALKPYHAATAAEYAVAGLPAIRHPYLHYEAERELHERAYQYLYGRDLMVAPVVAPKRELTELWLPRDEWVHLWSSRNFKGGSVTVDSPLGCPAVFYRASSKFAPLFDAIRRTAPRV